LVEAAREARKLGRNNFCADSRSALQPPADVIGSLGAGSRGATSSDAGSPGTPSSGTWRVVMTWVTRREKNWST
jgi:hypothetical protein